MTIILNIMEKPGQGQSAVWNGWAVIVRDEK
jgi:hypothetical protein